VLELVLDAVEAAAAPDDELLSASFLAAAL
jgi:hypothetical protein